MRIIVHELLTIVFSMEASYVSSVDDIFDQIVKYIDKRSLDVIACSKIESDVRNNSLFISMKEIEGMEGSLRFPIQITNDIDIITLMESLTLKQGNLEV